MSVRVCEDVVGWRSVSKEVMERDIRLSFFNEQYHVLFTILFTMNSTVHMNSIFFRRRKEKLGLGFFKNKRLGLEFLLWYHVRILEEKIFVLLLMWIMPQIYRHNNYIIRKPLILIQLILVGFLIIHRNMTPNSM